MNRLPSAPVRTVVRPLRIVITDDHPLILEGIANIVREANHEVMATCGNGRELLQILQLQRPDVVTLDIGMPGLNGIDLARQVRAVSPRVKIVIVTQQTDVNYIRSAFQSGGNAFVAKQSASTELLSALEAVSAGRQYLSPGLVESEGSLQLTLRNLERKQGETLTPRQREVLQLVAEGKTAKEIAAVLDISTKTVEFHKQALMNGLNLRSTAELTRYAIAHGLVFL